MSDRLIGFVENMPFDEYLKVDALSGSELMHMRRSPLYYRWAKDNPQEPTEDMKLGTVIHTAILEPPLVGKIAIWGELEEQKVRRGKVWDAFEQAHAHETILTLKEHEKVIASVAGVWVNANARRYLAEEGPCEISMFWVDPGTGMYMKGRLDKLIRTKQTATIADLKKTRDCSSYEFGRQSLWLGYHVKAAIYVSGYQILTGVRPKFKWIAIESKAPYECAVYRATPDVLSLGGEEMLNLVARLQECQASRNWPPEQEQESDLILPKYAYNGEGDFADLETVTEGD